MSSLLQCACSRRCALRSIQWLAGVFGRYNINEQEGYFPTAEMDPVLADIIVRVVVRIRGAADTIARLNVEPDAVAFFEHHRSWPNLHLHLDNLIGLKPLTPQMLVIRPIRTRK